MTSLAEQLQHPSSCFDSIKTVWTPRRMGREAMSIPVSSLMKKTECRDESRGKIHAIGAKMGLINDCQQRGDERWRLQCVIKNSGRTSPFSKEGNYFIRRGGI